MNEVVERPVHYIRGGSGSDRIVNCPGCVNEQLKWPSDPSGDAAIDGTHTHTLCEQTLTSGFRDCQWALNQTLTDHEGDFVVDQARIDRANVYVKFIRELLKPNAMAMKVEELVDAGTQFGIPEWGGSADCIVHGNGALWVTDYKDGGKKVSPESFQPITYALGALALLGWENFTTVYSVIVQPKVYDMPQIKAYTIHEFKAKAQPLIDAMRLSMDPNAPRNAGPHCKYCSGAKPGRCSEFDKGAMQVMDTMFNNPPPTIPGQVVATQTPSEMPLQIPTIDGSMSNEQLKLILDAAPVVRQWLKEAEAEGLKRAKAGQSIPEYKVVRGQTKRKWKHDTEETLKKLKGMKIPKAEYMEEKIKTPKQVEGSEVVKDFTDRKKKNFEDLIEKPTGALKLVPVTEAGEAIAFNADDMFGKDARALPETTNPPLSFL